MRRREAYHELVRRHVTSREAPKEGPASIHDLTLSKEQNLDALLRYDFYPRSVFRAYLFAAAKQWEDYDLLQLNEHRDLAGAPWEPTPSRSAGALEMRREALIRTSECEMQLAAAKTIKTRFADGVWCLECATTLSTEKACPLPLALGVEMVFNLLAPNAPDRYILANGTRYPLNFKGELEETGLVLVDEWQRVKIALTAGPSARWWIVPIETISQSEAGFERVYQGSAILAVWKIGTTEWNEISGTVTLEISGLD
jgi:alpha-amylase